MNIPESRAEAKRLSVKKYFTGKPCKHGHVSLRQASDGSCVTCKSLGQKTEKTLDRNRRRHANITAEKRELLRINRAKRKHLAAAQQKKWRENNLEKVIEYRKRTQAVIFMRRSIRRIEESIGKDRIDRAEVELGYTQGQFKRHIESLWLDGMSWDNRSEWHVDHIKPLSLFIKEGVTDLKIINALDNLQPLWAKDNIAKGAKYKN